MLFSKLSVFFKLAVFLQEYVYKYWVDHSARKEIGNSGKSVITRIKLKNGIEAGDYNTRVDMEAKKEEWKKNLNERWAATSN